MGSPLNFSGKASRGLTGGACMTGAGGGLAAACGCVTCTPCKAVTSCSVSAVRCCSCCWCTASCEAWAVSSVVSCLNAAGSLFGEVFCNETSDGTGSICSFIRVVKQEWVKHQQWEQWGLKQRRGQRNRQDGQGRRQISEDRRTRRGSNQETHNGSENAQRWQPGQIKTSHWVSVGALLLCVRVDEVQV